jgi:TRAP-type C4-dicarboxylate transport system permease small subunit
MLMTLVLMADISTRRTLNFAILGTIDLTQLAVMLAVFFALPLAFLHESHVNVDFFTSRLPRRAMTVLNCLVALLSTALLAAIVWYSLGQARIQFAQGDKSMTLGIPMLFYWVPMLLGTALSIVATLLVAAREAARACGVEVRR